MGDGETPNFLQYTDLGIDVSFDDEDRITCVIFFFHSSKHRPFQGTTSLGIGIDSSLDDVLKRYGTPTQIFDMTSYRQKYFYYHKDGITFVFKDGVLESIQIEKPKATWWPAEWPERRDTDKLNWLVFKPAALTGPVMHAQASFPEFAARHRARPLAGDSGPPARNDPSVL